MELIQLVVILIVVGVLLWAVNTFIPMDPQIKSILNAVIIIAIVLWLLFLLLNVFGIAHTRIGTASFQGMKFLDRA